MYTAHIWNLNSDSFITQAQSGDPTQRGSSPVTSSLLILITSHKVSLGAFVVDTGSRMSASGTGWITIMSYFSFTSLAGIPQGEVCKFIACTTGDKEVDDLSLLHNEGITNKIQAKGPMLCTVAMATPMFMSLITN